MKKEKEMVSRVYMLSIHDRVTSLEKENAEMKALLKEASDYLDTNNLTSVGHSSILHKKFKHLTS